MRVSVNSTWASAMKPTFNVDMIRRVGKRFYRHRLQMVVGRDADKEDVKSWLADCKMSYIMTALYKIDTKYGRVTYEGLAFQFKEECDAMLFKLRFN